MYISTGRILIVLTILVTVAVAEWEVLNDVNDGEREDFLESEHFIPADAIAKQNAKTAQRSLASVKLNGQATKGINTDLKVPELPPNPQNVAAPVQTDLKPSPNTKDASVQHMSQDSSAKQSKSSATSGSVQNDIVDDDTVDLATEGFLLAEPQKKVGNSASSRKLAQYDESYSEIKHRTRNVEFMSQENVDESTQVSSRKDVTESDKVEKLQEAASSPESTLTKAMLPSSPSTSSSSPSSSSLSSASTASSSKHEVMPHVAEGRQQVNARLQKLRQDKKRRLEELESVKEEDLDDDDWIDLNFACMDKSSWECLMFKEDYLASRMDANLSHLGGGENAERFKRQAGGPTTTPDPGSGDGLIFEDYKTEEPDLQLTTTSSFTTKENEQTLDDAKKKKIKDDLDRQLRQVFRNVPGFKNVIIDPDSIRIENGTLKADWRLVMDTGHPAFSGLTPDQIKDKLGADLEKVNQTIRDNVNIDGFPLLDFDLDDISRQLANQTSDPCSIRPSPCSQGYENCRQKDSNSIQITCDHKCVRFKAQHGCQHSGQCDVDMLFNPYCSCTQNWKGEFCENPVKNVALDDGEIAGVVIGGILTACGVVGCCCWFFLCFRKSDDIVYTHYCDEEGSGNFSDPSVKLGYVIDRPHVSVTPLFGNTLMNSGALRQSLGSDSASNAT